MGKLNLTSVCKTCGGRLFLDVETHISKCASCGNEYDYEYFYADTLLEDAKKTLTNEEYFSSYDMYNFYLEKNSDSEEALIGKYLSLGHFKTISEITSDKVISYQAKLDNSECIKYKGSRLGEIAELFRDMYKYAYQITRDEKKIQDKKNETSVLHEADSKIYHSAETADVKRTGVISLASLSKIKTKNKFLILAGTAILSVLSLVIGVQLENGFLMLLGRSLLFVFGAAILLFILAYLLSKQSYNNASNRLDENQERKALLKKEIFGLEKDIENHKEKLENTISKIKEFCKD